MSVLTEQTLAIVPVILTASWSLVGSATHCTDRETEAQKAVPAVLRFQAITHTLCLF